METENNSLLTWHELWLSSRARGVILFTALALLVIIFYLPVFYKEVIGPKPGMVIHDVVLNQLVPFDWSVATFSIIYLSILQTFLSIVRKPYEVLLALSSYLTISLLRMVAMYILTFDPPADMIMLVDPVTSHFYPSGGFAKDLFFSGHVSTMTLMVLLERKRWLRFLKIAGTLLVALFLAWQHVHYTLDILVAPLAALGVYRSVRQILKPVLKG